MPAIESKLLVVTGEHLTRTGLRLLLEALGHSVTEAASAREALAIADSHELDLIIADPGCCVSDPAEFCSDVRKRHERLPILLLGTADTALDVRGLIDAGAGGFISKAATVDQLNEAMGLAVRGDGLYVDPAVASQLIYDRQQDSEPLSTREYEVLALLVEGLSNQAIALKLSLSRKAVKTSLSSLYRKLRVSNRTQAVAHAMRQQII